jgi:hypothetical protein
MLQFPRCCGATLSLLPLGYRRGQLPLSLLPWCCTAAAAVLLLLLLLLLLYAACCALLLLRCLMLCLCCCFKGLEVVAFAVDFHRN